MAEGDPIRIIPHRGVDDDCGSLEVWFADGRKSVRFYWDNLVSRRLSGNTLTREQAMPWRYWPGRQKWWEAFCENAAMYDQTPDDHSRTGGDPGKGLRRMAKRRSWWKS
jgi:hypothetical protein